MKSFFFKLLLVLLALNFVAPATIQAAQRMSSRTIQTPKAAQYIPVKPEFKNLTLEPMTVDSVVDELAGIVVLCSTATPNTARSLPQSSQKMLSSVIQLQKAGKKEEAIQVWQRLIKGLKKTTTPVNVNELIYWIGQQTYLRSSEDLRFYASKVKFHNEQKKIIRNALNNNRRLLKSCRSAKRCSSATLGDMQKETKSLESSLQKARNQQQAALQSLEMEISGKSRGITNISRFGHSLHDNAKSIIQNLR